jgi:hypothetical protein
MRALATATILLALAGAQAAHADAPAEAPPKETPMSAVNVEKLLAFYNELVDEIVKNAKGSDCKPLAGAVESVVRRHQNTIEMSWWAKKSKQTLPKEAQEKMDKRALEMVVALKACWDDDGVKAAFRRMKPPKDKQ